MKDIPARRALLDSAKRLLWERGFEAMSPAAVLEDSGVGQGSLYHHFKTKRHLAIAALEETSAELIAAAEGLLTGDTPPLDRLERWLTLPRDGTRGCRIGRHGPERAVLEDETLRAPLTAYFTRLAELVENCLRDAAARGDILLPDAAVPAVATALIATIQGGYVISRAQADPAAIAEATTGALALLERLKPLSR